MHVHFVPHRVISRRPFNVGAYDQGQCTFDAGTCYSGNAEDPADREKGWVDTTIAPPGYVTTIMLNFTVDSYGKATRLFDPTENPGYVLHCHILDHEDNDMMRPFKVV